MRESSTYLAILERDEAIGRELGLEQGREEARIRLSGPGSRNSYINLY